jgi:hypothetical protein
MSVSPDAPPDRVKVREVAGVFQSREALEAAVDELLLAGFDRTDISLMADPETVHRKLGGIYKPAAELADDPRVPRRAYIARRELPIPMSGVAGLLFYIGATAAAFAVVASGGAAAAAAAAAAAGGAATGGFGLYLAKAIGDKEAKQIETQLAAGGIVLWVRVRSKEQEEQAERILRAHGGDAVHAHEIEIERSLDDIPLHELFADEVPAR